MPDASTHPVTHQHLHDHGGSGSLFEVFTPRQVCMNYESDVIATHLIADALIALAYFTIPFALVHFVRRRRDLSFNWIFWLFALFIVLCGTTHIFNVIALWSPRYRLDGIVKGATAVASLATAFALWRFMPRALTLPSFETLQRANEVLAAEVAQRQRAEADLAALNVELELRVHERTAELEALLVSAPIGTAIFDRAYRYVNINAVLAAINGHPREAHLGQTVRQMVPGNADAVEPIVDSVFASGQPVGNLELVGETPLRPGVVRYWLTGFYPIRAGADLQVTAVGAWVVEITDRKRAEEQRRQSEERLRTIVEAVPGQFWAATRHGQIDFVGPWLARYTGIPPQDLSGSGWIRTIHADDVEGAGNAWRHAVQSGEPLAADFRIRSADGSYRWFRTHAQAQRNAAGEIQQWFGYTADVDVIKRAEANLRRSEQRLQALADNSPDVLLRLDREAGIVFANSEAARVTGHPGHWLLGKTVSQLGLFAQVREEWDMTVARVFETGEPAVLEFAGAGAADTRDYVARVVPERDKHGRTEYVLAVITDITERRRAEREARRNADEVEEASRILRGIMDYVPEGITIASGPDVTVSMVSRHGAELVGRPKDTLIGSRAAEHAATWNLWRSDGSGQPSAEELPLTRAVRLGEDVVNEEWLIERPDGKRIPILCNAGPIRDSAGDIVGGVITFRDITQLRGALSDLQEASRRKDEFIATLAHELRNPLAPLRSGLELLRLDREPANDRVTSMMSRQLSHMVRLIDDLLDISRISSGKFVLQRDPVTLQVVIALAVEASRPIIDAGKHELEVSQPESPIWVNGDATRLAQVVSNLLNNSAKYTPQGGHIRVFVEEVGERAIVRVSDTGLGIPAELLDRVFDMFTQVNRTLHRAQGGLGIGLALIKRLVELHEGNIVAQSEGANRGSTFIVSLPRISAPAEEGSLARGTDVGALVEGAAGQWRVLVVDDNQDAADTLATLLTVKGYAVATAYDGATALQVSADLRPHVGILDIGMPGMSGHELARELLRRPAPPTLVALTGWASPGDKQATSESGFEHHLTKPVDTNALLGLLNEICSRRDAGVDAKERESSGSG